MRHGSDMSLGQSLMAANAPVMLQRAMVDGEPAARAARQRPGRRRLGDLPSCAELIQAIVREARARLAALRGDARPTKSSQAPTHRGALMATRTEDPRTIAELVLDHPPVNALDSQAWNELPALIERARRDPTCAAC